MTPGDFRRVLLYNKFRCFAFALALGPMDDVKWATGAGAINSRLFDILCNGLMLQQNFDVYKEAGGPFLAIHKTYRGLKPTPNGKLIFQFVPSKNYAFINAVEILDEAPAPKR